MYTQTINLNLIPQGVPPVIHVNQYENQNTAFTFKLYKGTEVFNVPSNAAVLMNGLKPDGNVFSYASSSVSGQTVTFRCEQQMVPVAGTVVCELRIRTTSEIIGTCNFLLEVEESPLHDDSVISETMIPLIEQAVDIAANLAEYIETTLNAAETATDAAETATTAAGEASVYNSNVQQMYNSLETVKANANAAAQAANTAAQAATETLENLSATATTLTPGSAATASYDSQTGVVTFGIPQGAKGDRGESGIQTPISGMYTLAVDADGYLYCYSNDEITESMFYYDEEEGNLYWMSPTTPIVTSVSGNMVTFVNKSSAENAVDVISDIAPIQSFNGYDNPWPAGGGKNLCKFLNYGYYTSDGTPSATTSKKNAIIKPVFVTAGKSIVMSTPNNGSGRGICVFSDAQLSQMIYRSSSWTNTDQNLYELRYTANQDCYVSFWYNYNNTDDMSDSVFEIAKLQIEINTSATSYAPYSNICPISGRTVVNVHVSPTTDAADGTAYSVTFPAEAGTVYGGTLDVVTGELVVDRAMVDMTAITDWTVDKSARRIFKVRSDIKANTSSATVPNLLSNRFEAITLEAIYNYNMQGVSLSAGSALQFHIDGLTDKADVTLTEVNQWFIDNPTTICYELAEPQTYQLTPQNVKILKGTNNIWSDSGDVTVKYNRWELE